MARRSEPRRRIRRHPLFGLGLNPWRRPGKGGRRQGLLLAAGRTADHRSRRLAAAATAAPSPSTPPPARLLDLPTDLLVRIVSRCDFFDIARVAAVSLLFHASLAAEGIRLWAQERGFELPAQPENEGCAARWFCFSALLRESNPPARAAAGEYDSLFIDGEGRLSSCGSAPSYSTGLLGHGEGVTRLNTPTRLPSTLGGERAVSVSAGGSHKLALTADGAVWSWGYGAFGRLGHGDTQRQLLPKKLEAFAGQRVVAVSAGERHSFAITADEAVWSWGYGAHGELGHGDAQRQLLPKKIEAFDGQRVLAVSAKGEHSLALTADGAVWSWGYGGAGRLFQNQLLPKKVEALAGQRVVAVSAGGDHSLALTADGAVWSWGLGGAGQLGDGDGQSQLLPKKVEAFAGQRVVAVSAGERHSFAITADGAVWSWGEGVNGKLGNGNRHNRLLPKRSSGECPPTCVHVGAPPNGVELFAVIHRYLGFKHIDPKGDHLNDLVEILADADGADLVLIDWCATPCFRMPDGTLVVAPDDESVQDYRSPDEMKRYERYSAMNGFMVTYSPIRTIALHRVPPDSERATLPNPEMSSSVWITYELMLAAYCQRVVNAGDAVIKSMISPDTLTDPIGIIHEGVSSGRLNIARQSDIDDFIVPNLQRSLASMLPVYDDDRGFRSFCFAAEIAWVKVSYIRRFVALLDASPSEPRPFPRRQELPRGTFYVGLPPDGRRNYVVSHGWATEHHPSPSGAKLRHLLAAIDADAGASDDDGVFLDFCSLDQRARPQPAGRPPQRERTIAEARRFYLALWEMTRMYAFRGCRVIVLPAIEPWQLFEAAGTEPESVHSDVKKRMCQRSVVWGWVNDVPYHRRGWCFAEFSCARKAGIIVNESDAAVQRVLHARKWPSDVQSYTRDMEDPDIEFTSKGDREYVAYIFNKMSFDPRVAMRA